MPGPIAPEVSAGFFSCWSMQGRKDRQCSRRNSAAEMMSPSVANSAAGCPTRSCLLEGDINQRAASRAAILAIRLPVLAYGLGAQRAGPARTRWQVIVIIGALRANHRAAVAAGKYVHAIGFAQGQDPIERLSPAERRALLAGVGVRPARRWRAPPP